MKKLWLLLITAAIAVILAAAYLAYRPRPHGLEALIQQLREGRRTRLLVAGVEAGPIPRRYTCDGADESPPVQWDPVPGAKAYALIVYDPDAPKGVFIHWLIYNIPAGVDRLPAGVPRAPLTRLGVQGINSFGRLGYGGPCPPPGPPHHYHFLLLALDGRLDLRPGATAPQLLEALRGHVVGYGEAVLTYRRG